MRKCLRRFLCIFLLLVLLTGVALLALKFYLTSNKVRRQIEARLEQVYGGPVHIDSAAVGLWGPTSLRGLELFEVDAGPDAAAWASAAGVQLDLSAWDLLWGVTQPRGIVLSGVTVDLRFDRQGNLLTRFPEVPSLGEKVPPIHVENGQVALEQEGHPPLQLQRIAAHLSQEEQSLPFHATIADPSWGNWSVTGAAEPAQGSFAATLQTPRATLSQAQMESLPFVPARTWREVKATGTSAVAITYQYLPRQKAHPCRVVLDPDEIALDITAAHLHADRVRGRMVIENDVVRLEKVHGQVLGGNLQADGELDFRSKEDRLDLTFQAADLDIGHLPSPWNLPAGLRQVSGTLRGQARLIFVHDDSFHVSGTGKAVIDDVRIAGQPADPIHLQLRPAAAGADAPALLEASLKMRDADLERLLAGFDLSTALPVSGRLTCGVDVRLPLEKLHDPQALVVTGTVTLKPLVVAGLTVDQVSARLESGSGVLRLSEVQGTARGARLTGQGEVGLKAPYALAGKLELADSDLGQWLWPSSAKPASPTLAGRLDVHGEVQGTIRPWRVTLSGTATSDALRWEGFRIGKLLADWVVKEGRLRLDNVRTELYGGEVNGNVEVPLRLEQTGHALVGFSDVDLGALTRDVPGLKLRLEGRVNGTGEGTLSSAAAGHPRQVHAAFTVSAPRLQVHSLPLEGVAGTISYHPGGGEYHLKGRLLGGTFDLDGPLPAWKPSPSPAADSSSASRGKLHLSKIDLRRLAGVLGSPAAPLQPMRSTLDLQLEFTLGGPEPYPVGTGSFAIEDLRWDQTTLASAIHGVIELTGREAFLLRCDRVGG